MGYLYLAAPIEKSTPWSRMYEGLFTVSSNIPLSIEVLAPAWSEGHCVD